MCDPTWTEATINAAIIVGSWETAKFLLNRFARWLDGGRDV